MLNVSSYSKFIIKSLVAASLICQGAAALASGVEEGKTILKVRGHFAIPQHKQTYNQNLSATNLASTGKKILSTGFGGEVAVNYFVTDNIAAEVSVGITAYKLQAPLTANVAGGASVNYNQLTLSKKSTNKKAYLIPVTALVQYHIMPDEQFNPYVGLGYHYTMAQGSSGVAKLSSLHGAVAQVGFDFWDNDDMSFNMDIKKYWGTTKATYKYLTNSVTNAPLKSKIKMDPFVISAGVGFRL
jgi:outer membrane protein